MPVKLQKIHFCVARFLRKRGLGGSSMKKYYYIIQVIVALVVFSLIGMTTLPTKVDIENLEVVEIIGLDKTENKVKVTALLKESGESTGESNEQNSSSSAGYKTVAVDSVSYSQAVDILRNVTDKYISLSHVKYYVIGEEVAQESLRDAVDYLSRTDDLESTSRIYIADNMSAEEFLKKVVDSNEDIVSNIEDKTSDLVARNSTVKVTVLDVLDMFLQDKIEGVIPYISVIQGENSYFEEYDGKEKTTDSFGFESAGIVENMKVVSRLTGSEVMWYNMAKSDVQSIVIAVNMGEDESVVLNCNREKYMLSFDVNGESIESINLKLEFIANIEEAKTNSPLFNSEYIKKIQENCQNEMKENVTVAIKKCIESGIDYMKLGDLFELRHPYVYRKVKNNFLEKLMQASINVDIEVSVNNTYDVMQSNIYQKGGK